MLMRPPAPPNPSMTNEKATASIMGFCQGNALSHPSTPRPPRKRAAISTEAVIVNTVSKVGIATSAVNTEWTNLNPAPTSGSLNK